MLAASQDIDNFIERQRSKLNRQPSNRPAPPPPGPPPAVQASRPVNNVEDRLDFKVARILDEPPPQGYYQPSSPRYANNPYPDQQASMMPEQQQQQQYRRTSNGDVGDNPEAFFNKFGTYDDKRSQLKDDLKREYNEYLQSQKRGSKSKSTSQLTSPRANNNNNNNNNNTNNRRVQFQPNNKVVAPWEKGERKSVNNVQSMQDLSSTITDYPPQRSRPPDNRNQGDQYVRDREEYISELHAQIRELESKRRQLETQSNKLSAGGSSQVNRAHYTEDLNALNSLLAERLDQRSAVDLELAHILNRPPVSHSPTRLGSGNLVPQMNMPFEPSHQQAPAQRFPQANGRHPQYQNERKTDRNDNGFQIGQQTDKESEQAAKKRYQQELQSQMREAQMRKAQSKQEKDDYERKLDADIQRYNYFGRSGGGGGAPMRDKEGNVVANLADLRNPPPSGLPPSQYSMPDDKVYTLGNGTSSMANAPFYMGESQPQQKPPSSYPGNTDRAGSPTNHARGAVSNGMFGAAKTEEQFAREDKYKQDLKRQIDEKRQLKADEVARRRAEEEQEIAKHLEWQQKMDRQAAEDAAKKQNKEEHERQLHQQMQEDLERQKQQEEIAGRRKPRRMEKPMTPKQDDANNHASRPNQHDEPNHHQQQQHPPPPPADNAYRSSSPPIPTLKNKGKKPKAKVTNARRPSFDDAEQRASPPAPSPAPLPPLDNDEEFDEPPPADERVASQGRQTYRKPPTPRQPDVSSARKKPPQTHQPRTRPPSNTGLAMRTQSSLSLRSDGSDSEVLNRLEHLKRQLKDKEARLQEHVIRHQADPARHDEPARTTYQPPSQPPTQRKQSPGFLLNATRMHHRDSPTNNDRVRRLLQTDDDLEFKPSYFRDDTTLMSGIAGGQTGRGPMSAKRIDSADRLFGTKIEKEASRRHYGLEPSGYYDREDPTAMANFELNRIAQQNEQRLKKLRDLEHDDASLLDSNEVLERFQQKQRLQRGGSQTTLQDDAWLK